MLPDDHKRADGWCNCHKNCCDVDDDIGACKGLPIPPSDSPVELVMVHRNDPIFDRPTRENNAP
jgi:hypothetical protein